MARLATGALVAAGVHTAAISPSPASLPPPRIAAPVQGVAEDRFRYARPQHLTLHGETRSVSSLLRVKGPLHFGAYVWNERDAAAGETWARVDLARQTMSVFRGGDEIGTAVVLFGSDAKPTPRGRFTVLERDRDHRSSLYDAPMPFMLRLTGDGVAIHASDVRTGSATHGCIGVPPGFARLLFGVMRRGARVHII